MESVSTTELVLATIETQQPEEHSEGEATMSLSTLTQRLAGDGSQLSKQLEIAVTIETLTEEGLLERTNSSETQELTLTPDGRERGRAIIDSLASMSVELVENGSRRELDVATASAELDRPLVEIVTETTDAGVYYRHDDEPTEAFVGREDERTQLSEAIERAIDRGHGELFVLSGPSGVGKTTLGKTALDSVLAPTETVQVHCQEGGGEPYQPIRDALEQLDSESPFERIDHANESPDSYQANQTALFHDITTALTPADGARVLFFDDFDHADTATWTYFDYLWDRLADLPLVVLCTHRPGTLSEETPLPSSEDGHHATGDSVAGTRVRLTGLGRTATERLIAQILGHRDIPSAFADAIYERTDGNPLFVETTIDTLLENNQLDPEFEWYPRSVDEIDLPDAVQDTIAQRLDSIGSDTRTVLEWVAIAGDVVSVEVLTALCDLSPAQVGTILETLIEAEMVLEDRQAVDRNVSIRNDLVRDELLDSLDSETRRERHAAVASELEEAISSGASSDDSAIETVATVAYHHEQAGNETAAIEWYRRAADQATDLYAHETANTHYHSVLDLARSLDAEETILETGHDLAELSLMTAEYDQAERYVQFVRERTPADATTRRRKTKRLAAEIATARGDPKTAVETAQDGLGLSKEGDTVRCRLLAVKGDAERQQSEYDAAEQTCEELRALAKQLGEPALEARADRLRGVIYSDKSDHDRSRECYQRALETVTATDSRHLESKILNGLGITFERLSRPDKAREYYEDALAIAKDIEDREQAARLYNNLAIIGIFAGDLTEATEYCQQALDIGMAFDGRRLCAILRINIGIIAARRTQFEDARAYQQQALDALREMDDDRTVGVTLLYFGETEARAGEYDRASEHYQEALDLLRSVGDDLHIVKTTLWLASLETERGDYNRARTLLDQAREIDTELDNPIVRANVAATAAWLAVKCGEYDRAESRATDALEHFRDRGLSPRVGDVLHTLAVVAIERGDEPTAVERLDAARDIAEGISNPSRQALITRERGRLARQMGEYDRADRLLSEALTTFETTGIDDEAARTRLALGDLRAATGDVDAARDNWERALDTFLELDSYRDTLDTLQALVSHCGESAPADGEAWCQHALEIARERDDDWYQDHREWFETARERDDDWYQDHREWFETARERW
jgi:predicted ATPase